MLKKRIQWLEKMLSFSRLTIKLYMLPYKKIVLKEIALAKLEDQHIIFVGCGAIPFTALYIARYTNCKITAIDIDKEALKTAKRVVKKLNAESQITLMSNDTFFKAQRAYDLVFLSLQTTPLKAMIKRLYQPKVKFMTRVAKAKYQTHYDTLPQDIDVIAKTAYRMKAFDETWLFEIRPYSL